MADPGGQSDETQYGRRVGSDGTIPQMRQIWREAGLGKKLTMYLPPEPSRMLKCHSRVLPKFLSLLFPVLNVNLMIGIGHGVVVTQLLCTLSRRNSCQLSVSKTTQTLLSAEHILPTDVCGIKVYHHRCVCCNSLVICGEEVHHCFYPQPGRSKVYFSHADTSLPPSL